MAIIETKDASLNLRIPKELFDTLVKRVTGLSVSQAEYIRTLITFETGTQLLGIVNIEGLHFDNVEELIKEKNESLSLREKLSEIQLKLDQRITRMSYLEASIKKTLRDKQKKKRSKKKV